MQADADNRTLGEMVSDLWLEMRTLISQELQLAKVEMTGKAARLTRGIAFMVAGGLVAYAGVLALVAALVLGLMAAMQWPAWLAALTTGLVVMVLGTVVLRVGLAKLRPRDLLPERTIQTIQEDAPWLTQPR